MYNCKFVKHFAIADLTPKVCAFLEFGGNFPRLCMCREGYIVNQRTFFKLTYCILYYFMKIRRHHTAIYGECDVFCSTDLSGE